MMRYGAYHGVGTLGPWMIGAAIFKLVIFIAIIYVAYRLIKKHNFSSRTALVILSERYAKGEIDEEEYQMKH